MSDVVPPESDLLPLFPLSKVVLFPRTELPLFIFEPRYKEMIGRCLETGGEFGVLLVPESRPGMPEREAACRVGGAGKVRWHKVVGKGGEMHILVRGTRRFRVVDFEEVRAGFALDPTRRW